jgi:hypothetical protein
MTELRQEEDLSKLSDLDLMRHEIDKRFGLWIGASLIAFVLPTLVAVLLHKATINWIEAQVGLSHRDVEFLWRALPYRALPYVALGAISFWISCNLHRIAYKRLSGENPKAIEVLKGWPRPADPIVFSLAYFMFLTLPIAYLATVNVVYGWWWSYAVWILGAPMVAFSLPLSCIEDLPAPQAIRRSFEMFLRNPVGACIAVWKGFLLSIVGLLCFGIGILITNCGYFLVVTRYALKQSRASNTHAEA